jgi:pre-mRNA-processing factor 6
MKKAMENCPKVDIFWLMYAKRKWKLNDIEGANSILKEALNILPNNENIILAIVKILKFAGKL